MGREVLHNDNLSFQCSAFRCKPEMLQEKLSSLLIGANESKQQKQGDTR